MNKIILLVILLSAAATAAAQPLSTSSRWVVNQSGNRVKLSCVNWVAHLEVVVAEGLSWQPLDVISDQVKSLGFNCVRMTWPLYLMTNQSLASTTVRESFMKFGLKESISGVEANNPAIIDLTLIDAFRTVVTGIASNNVMVILDNHRSQPGWCCPVNDGNGFFGDRYFDPKMWIRGLTKVATMFHGVSNVVGMSLRNELRGPKQNVNDWYRYMQEGAEAVHAANPNVLVIVSGLIWDTDLSFLHHRTLNLSFTGKLVFEVHWYRFSNPHEWERGSANEVCGRITNSLNRRAGFLVDEGVPLFLGEFGIDQSGVKPYENRFLNCLLGWAVEKDVDFAFWTLQGSYYINRDKRGRIVRNDEEFYGIYSREWNSIRNSSYLQWISVLQTTFQGPGGSQENAGRHKLLFHTATGLCVKRSSVFKSPELGPCSEADLWDYSSENFLTIKGFNLCLQAYSVQQPAKLGFSCSKWKLISDTRMHISSKLHDGTEVCLDVDDSNVIVTSKCRCLTGNSTRCDPVRQWFKIIE